MRMSARARELKLLELGTGKCPFEAWYKFVRDIRARQRIFSTITRLADPACRTFKLVVERVQELRIFHGPGYRVYFAMKGDH
jgi:putative addiction module killer protein